MVEDFTFNLSARKITTLKVCRPKASDPTQGQDAGITYLDPSEDAVSGPYLDDEDRTCVDIKVTDRPVGQLIQVGLQAVRPPLSGMLGWYDAGDLELADGDTVESFPDQSGNGWDLSQLYEILLPSYSPVGVNGFPGVGGPGTELFLAGEGTVDYELSDYTVFVVCSFLDDCESQFSAEFRFRGFCDYIRDISFERRLSEEGNYIFCHVVDYCNGAQYSGGSSSVVGLEPFFGTFMAFLPTDHKAATVFYNNESIGNSFGPRDYDDIFNPRSGDAMISLQFTDSYVAEVLMYGRSLTKTERGRVFEYLMHKYQLPEEAS